MSEILERGVFLNCLLDQTEAPWKVEVEMIRCHDAALRLALETATRERDDIAAWAESWMKRVATAERERDEARVERAASVAAHLAIAAEVLSLGLLPRADISTPDAVRMVCDAYRLAISERDEALLAKAAPPADAATEAVQALDRWDSLPVTHRYDYEAAKVIAAFRPLLVALSPAPAPSAKEGRT